MTFLGNLFDREADRCFAEAARLAPRSPKWPFARGHIALRREPEKAVPLLRQALAAAGPAWAEYESPVRLQLAEALLERQEWDEAETLFREEERRRPGNPRTALGLGMLALARGDERAAEEYLAAVRDAPAPTARKMAAAQLAALARSRGDTAAAAAFERESAALPGDEAWPDPVLDEAVRLQTGERGRERAATALEKQHRFAEARNIYLEQLKKRSTSRDHVGAGYNLAQLGKYDEALPHLRDGVRLDPDSANAHYTLALVQYTRAEKERLVSPDSSQAREWLREAVEHARRAAELKPGHGRAYLFWGLALRDLGESAAAVAPLRKGVTCLPTEIDLQVSLGDVLLNVGRDDEAKVYLENARQLDPNDPRVSKALERLHKKKP
jgi:tetratricopeptide (TPR) repeat protein